MKRAFCAPCLLLCAALALTACASGSSGGGGGGGGSGMLSNDQVGTVVLPEQVKVASVADVAELAALSPAMAGIATEDGLDVGSNLALKSGSLILYEGNTKLAEVPTGAKGDISIYGKDGESQDWVAVNLGPMHKDSAIEQANEKLVNWDEYAIPDDKYPTFEMPPGYESSLREERLGSSMVLNTGVGLEHSTFGAWIETRKYSGKLTQEADEWGGAYTADFGSGTYVFRIAPLWNGDEAKMTSPAAGTFTGQAVALAHMQQNSFSKVIFGDVSANVSGISAMALKLDFPNMYEIVYGNFSAGTGVSVSNGRIAGDSPTVTYKDGIEDGYKIASGRGSLAGQFYGNSGDASEAVGYFQAGQRGHDTPGVYGTFGVKR
jgi:hypothetical protein